MQFFCVVQSVCQVSLEQMIDSQCQQTPRWFYKSPQSSLPALQTPLFFDGFALSLAKDCFRVRQTDSMQLSAKTHNLIKRF